MRVIAGKVGGLQLHTLKGSNTRPTSDRVKESLFSILTPHLHEADVLDLFAGSGSLAIEALSRGAKRALLVDDSKGAVAVIRRNLAHTQLSECAEVWQSKVASALRRLDRAARRFDLVFVDPPYGQGLAVDTLHALDAAHLLHEEGLIVIEHANKEEMPGQAQNLTLVRKKVYGDTVVSIFGRLRHS